MPVYRDFDTKANFHLTYLKLMLRERRWTYRKNKLADVLTPSYLNELQTRLQDTLHLSSLRHFQSICQTL